jgi:hypothetical protein
MNRLTGESRARFLSLVSEVVVTDIAEPLWRSDDAAVYANFTNSQKCWAPILLLLIWLSLLL